VPPREAVNRNLGGAQQEFVDIIAGPHATWAMGGRSHARLPFAVRAIHTAMAVGLEGLFRARAALWLGMIAAPACWGRAEPSRGFGGSRATVARASGWAISGLSSAIGGGSKQLYGSLQQT